MSDREKIELLARFAIHNNSQVNDLYNMIGKCVEVMNIAREAMLEREVALLRRNNEQY